MLKFTPGQLALLGYYFFNEDDVAVQATYKKIAEAIFDFVALNDPYDEKLLEDFVKSILNEDDVLGKLKDEKTLAYFVAKCEYWAKLSPSKEDDPRT